MALITAICTIFILIVQKEHDDKITKILAGKNESATVLAESLLSNLSQRYQERIVSFADSAVIQSRKEMIQAFADRDREKLLKLNLPLLTLLQKENPSFSNIGWILPDNRVFLRVASPEKFGDDVSKIRPDVAAVNRDRLQRSGFDVGIKTMQYHIVQPVFFHGKYLGAVQFGIKGTLFSETLQKKLQTITGMAVVNNEFPALQEADPKKLKGRTHTIISEDAALFQPLQGQLDWSKNKQRILLQGKPHVLLNVLPMSNANNENLGVFFVALDISEEIAYGRKLSLSILTIITVLLVLSFLTIYFSYGPLVQKISTLNQSLEKNNLVLEERVRDRTKALHKEIEERKSAEETAQRASKMEAIGLMAGGVAHDLNNILSGIVSYPELLLLDLPKESKSRKPLEAIQAAGKRAAAVVADLLTVSRGAASDRHIINLNNLIQEYFDSPEWKAGRWHSPQIQCRQEYDTDLLNISCSPVHVKKCFINLINNGLEAIDGDGEIRVTTHNRYVDNDLAKTLSLTEGEYVVASVLDSGSGIDSEDREHIFEPFYTKRKMGRGGTGLGLAIVWNTMQEHGGIVTIESGTDGTRFDLYFPCVRQAVTTLSQQNEVEDLQGNGEKVLVVDDEAQQRDIATQMLSVLGYNVTAVSSGEEAVAYVQEKEADLLVLDMIMDPGINGRETYEQITALHPGQKAIIASGYSETSEVKRAQSLGAGIFLRKPYSISQLGMAVKQALANKNNKDIVGNGT